MIFLSLSYDHFFIITSFTFVGSKIFLQEADHASWSYGDENKFPDIQN